VRELHLGLVEEKPSELLLSLALSCVLTVRRDFGAWREFAEFKLFGGGGSSSVMVVQDVKLEEMWVWEGFGRFS